MTNHSFKVGDWVKVTKPENRDEGPGWTEEMDIAKIDGKVFQIDRIGVYIHLSHSARRWCFIPEWLTPAEDPTAPKVPAPPAGYRILRNEELLREGDMFSSTKPDHWRPVKKHRYGQGQLTALVYARKIEEPQAPAFPESIIYGQKTYLRKADEVAEPGNVVLMDEGNGILRIFEPLGIVSRHRPFAVYALKPPAPKPLWETLDLVPKRVRFKGEEFYLETNGNYVPTRDDKFWNSFHPFRLASYCPASTTDKSNVSQLARVHKFLVYRKSTKGT